MRVVKNTAAVLLAMLIAVSSFIIGYAENNEIEEPEEKENIEIRLCEEYANETILTVFSDIYINAYETVTLYQRDENNEKTLVKSIPCEGYCYTHYKAPETTFAITLPAGGIFVSQGRYTLEFTAKETPPEGCEKEKDFSFDFCYEDIVNPEYENTNIDFTIEVGQKADISEILALPENYLIAYNVYENREDDFFDEQIIEFDQNSFTGISRGNTLLVVEDVYSADIVAFINIRVVPETPDNFLGLIGSTMGIIGTDTLKSFIQLGSYGGVGLGGLFYTLLFPIIAILSFFGALLGL